MKKLFIIIALSFLSCLNASFGVQVKTEKTGAISKTHLTVGQIEENKESIKTENRPVTLEDIKKALDEFKATLENKESKTYADTAYLAVHTIRKAAMIGGAVYLWNMDKDYNWIPFFLVWGGVCN